MSGGLWGRPSNRNCRMEKLRNQKTRGAVRKADERTAIADSSAGERQRRAVQHRDSEAAKNRRIPGCRASSWGEGTHKRAPMRREPPPTVSKVMRGLGNSVATANARNSICPNRKTYLRPGTQAHQQWNLVERGGDRMRHQTTRRTKLPGHSPVGQHQCGHKTAGCCRAGQWERGAQEAVALHEDPVAAQHRLQHAYGPQRMLCTHQSLHIVQVGFQYY